MANASATSWHEGKLQLNDKPIIPVPPFIGLHRTEEGLTTKHVPDAFPKIPFGATFEGCRKHSSTW
jgi:hypothetical protein